MKLHEFNYVEPVASELYEIAKCYVPNCDPSKKCSMIITIINDGMKESDFNIRWDYKLHWFHSKELGKAIFCEQCIKEYRKI